MRTVMPKVKVYPECSKRGVPYVLRQVFIITPKPGQEWLWQRDCKHRKAPPVSGDEKHHAERAEKP